MCYKPSKTITVQFSNTPMRNLLNCSKYKLMFATTGDNTLFQVLPLALFNADLQPYKRMIWPTDLYIFNTINYLISQFDPTAWFHLKLL